MSKHKHIKQKYGAQDRQDNRKFLTVLVVATVLLMLMMYFLFIR